jgi:hypothetical protein
MTPGVLYAIRYGFYAVEDTITIGIRWVRMTAQSCRPTVSEEASSRLGRWIGGARRSHSGCSHSFTSTDHLGPTCATLYVPGTRIQAKCSTHLDGRLMDYGKDEVAGKLQASSREEARVVDDGNRHRAPEPPATLAKTTTAMLVNSPLSRQKPRLYAGIPTSPPSALFARNQRFPLLKQVSLRKAAVSDWSSFLAVCSSPGLLGQ